MSLARKRRQLSLVIFLLLLHLLIAFAGFKGLVRDRRVDFRSFYASGRILRAGDGAHLYDYETQRLAQDQAVLSNVYGLRFLSPPYTALLFVPLTFLPFLPAYLVFLAFNLLLVALTLYLLRPSLTALRARVPLGPLLLFFTFLPLLIALGQGQLSVIVLCLVCAAFVALQRERSFLAGLLLALGLIKFQVVIPIAVLFLLWRRWAFVAGFSAGTLVLGAFSLPLFGITRLAQLRQLVVSIPQTFAHSASQLRVGTWPERMPTLGGLDSLLFHDSRLSLALTLAASALLLLWAARKPPSLPLATLVSVLICDHAYMHDLSVLLLPLSLLLEHQLHPAADTSAAAEPPRRQHWRHSAGLFALALLLSSPVTLILMGADHIALLAIPILVLTLTLGAPPAHPAFAPSLDLTPQPSPHS